MKATVVGSGNTGNADFDWKSARKGVGLGLVGQGRSAAMAGAS
jgi:hypothetical protein